MIGEKSKSNTERLSSKKGKGTLATMTKMISTMRYSPKPMHKT
jgi:hypothetical protein